MMWMNMIAWQIWLIASVIGLVYFTWNEDKHKGKKFVWFYLTGFIAGVLMQYFFPA